MERRREETRIHSLDLKTLARAFLWALAFEGACVLLLVGGGGGGSTGAPHNFPANPLVLLFILLHLPAIAGAGLLGGNPLIAVALQLAAVTYVLFVRLRLKKIKVKL